MIGVVSHDAGGAEILSSYIAQQDMTCIYSLDGPAKKIFERKLGPLDVVSLEAAIQQSDWVLTGTSWQSDIEWRAIKMAKSHNKRSVSFLDHWGNYRERFIREEKLCLPDEIWVGDPQAELMARSTLPEVKTYLVTNPYFEDIKRELDTIVTPNKAKNAELTILFVSEPLREHGLREYGNERHWGYTEEEALHYFLSNLHALKKPIRSITIRPHPAEPLNKYDWVKLKYKLPIINGGVGTLLEEVATSDVVVGFESMAMVVGLLAGKRVISCIPPGGKVCALPQMEIEYLQNILRNSQ